VQAKITKAADYIASVYHYMEYEQKFSEYGKKLEDSDIYTEAVKQQFVAKLTEARVKLEKLKKKNIADLKEEEEMKVGDTKKTSTGGTITKTAKGIIHKAKPWDGEDHTEPAQKKASKKAMTGDERRKQKAQDKEQEKKTKDWEKRFGKGSVIRVRDGEKVDEAAKPDFLDMDKDGDKKEPMKKAIKDKKEKKVEEGSTGDYSAKKARAGKDIGKPGKQFAKIAKSAGEKYGSKERGEKVAGAVLAKLRKG
jgi:hypothetical protein